ncbi:MAG: hypothetical protein NTZ17_06095 [Phycisphaerae bacterium]|nr:hypothetical protein [Phycisphaerae bacterium]
MRDRALAIAKTHAVDQEGKAFKPGFFVSANLHAPIVPDLLAVLVKPEIICRDNVVPKLLDIDAALGITLFKQNDICLSLGMDMVYDFGKEISRAILYCRVSTHF